MKQFKLFIILFLLFLVQGTVMPRFFYSTSDASVQMVPQFVFVALLLVTLFGRLDWGFRYSLLFGFLTDIIFTPVLGVYAFSMALTVYLTYRLSRWVTITVVSALLLSNFGLLVEQFIVYLIYLMIGMTQQSFWAFLSAHLVPTMLLNAAFALISFYPLRRVMESTAGKR
ncbi:rod shape-determining protein MreD [Sporolactobacillus spathodeae]|uniref:Rod shape-determining protein MreD n=1 Tax=Sporolactobacillus spathodeae TaxID=1465502 RepID=A0ABS2Q6U8_9BACL|nr:rod shape-determining protein MreD [Sporolactobacillus spathodeae]MBM7657448.1 rod shape-determining protein MreD [Sporolactobacillus spathodeae]